MKRLHPCLWRALVLGLLVLALASPQAFAHGQPKPDKKALLLVAFGTSVPKAWAAFDAIDRDMRKAFPGVEVRWAYTSKIIREKVAKEQKKTLDSPIMALAKLGDDGFTQVAVQSLQTIPGEEYEGLMKTAQAFAGLPKGIRQIEMGAPLLCSTEDVEKVAQALLESLPKRGPGEAVVFMGHGTKHPANIYYPGMQFALSQKDPLAFVATVEGWPALDDAVKALSDKGVKKTLLVPFMAVAGDHAHNDMAGKEDDSFASVMKKAGIATVPVLRGTGEVEALRALWVAHAKAAFDRLK